VVKNWWETNNLQETGTLEFVNDIKDLDTAALARIVNEGPVDLLGGGSPCNQLTRNNRQSTENPRGRSGVLGVDSRLFLEYPRVLNQLEMLQLRAGKRPVKPV
jgi:site-specific DNA-cytosine methylase